MLPPANTLLPSFFAFAGTQTANTPRSTNNQSNASDTTIPQGPNPIVILYISLSFAVSLASTVWIFYRISGGQFNPAVTLSLYLSGALPPLRAILLIPAQLSGSICSAYTVKYIFPGPLAVNTSLSGGTTRTQGVFIEMFLTAQLVLTILMLAVEKHRATFLAPLGIGMSLFMAEMAGVYYTGGSLNPARSFGPAVSNGSYTDQWVYWVGPPLGAVFATGFWKFVKVLRYEEANPGQDGYIDEEEGRRLLEGEMGRVTGERRDRPGLLRFGNSFGRPLSFPEEVYGGSAAGGRV
jgi:aquaporin rerated protein, other eukaryote